MNKTDQSGAADRGSVLSAELGRIPPTALQDATKVAQMLGCSMEQAAAAFQRCGEAIKKLEAENERLEHAAIAKRPWYLHCRW